MNFGSRFADAMHDEKDLRVCLQSHVDPVTGTTSYVFSRFNQDQELDRVDFHALRQRLGQNTLQEKVTAQWIDRSLRKLGMRA